jgi:AraC family transcriptional regulator, ethanolamine operon transcriptional activator
MSFFETLAHRISANARDASSRAASALITRAADIDEFLETIRGYRVRLLQIDKGPLVAEAVQTQLAETLFTATQYTRSVVHSGDPPSGKLTFAVGTSRVPALWQGRHFGPRDLVMVLPGNEIEIVSRPGYSIAAASFPLELVKETADTLGWTPAANGSKSLLVGLDQNKADVLRGTLGAVINEAVARPFDEQATTWAFSKQEDLLRILLACVRVPPTQPVRNGERARVLKAALTAINDRPEDIFTVGDLCRIAKASERTLHYAFTERFGLAPAHYMKARRLNGARNDLCRGDECLMKIADVANKWGFWHLGQFAKDYQNWFGELPSDTYARSHGTNPRRGGRLR